MAYLAIALLVLAISVLFLNRVLGIQQLWPSWSRSAKRHDMGDDQAGRKTSAGLQNGQSKSPPVTYVDGPSEEETTPKATAHKPGSEVPVFSLSEHAGADEPKTTPPAFKGSASVSGPKINGERGLPDRSTGTPDAPSTGAQKGVTSLMPPPPRPNSRPPSNAASSLRVPSTGPLPNRGPPANSQQRVSSTLSPAGTLSTQNARGKVLLAPGHSPMDWAALTRKNNLSGVSTFQRVTPSKLKSMTGRKGKPAWSSWQGKVYNLTPYLPFHPGGEAEMMKAAGRDGTRLFMDVHPWVNWENMLGACLVGAMVSEDYEEKSAGSSSLEDID